MITRGELVNNILGNLDDLGITFYTKLDVEEAVKDVYNRYAVLTGCITKSTGFSKPDGPYLPIKQYLQDYLFPVAIHNPTTGVWLRCLNTKYFDQIRWDWELWDGEPQLFSPIDFVRVAIIPHQKNPSGELTLVYRASPGNLTDESIFNVPTGCETLLEHYATADLLEQAKEVKKASTYWRDFQQLFVESKVRIKALAESDKMRVMAPYNSMPRF